MAYNIKSTFTYKEPLNFSFGTWPNGLNNNDGENLHELLSQLTADGKTDGELNKIDELKAVRYFSDRASAETWQAALSEYLTTIVECTTFTNIIEEVTE